MSRILVIPDVHLKPWIFDMADEVDQSKYDNVVVLGDLVDDFGESNNFRLYISTIDRAIKFGEDHKDSLWCLGNHDYAYLHSQCYNSGYSMKVESTTERKLNELINTLGDRVGIVAKVNNVLFSHAGISQTFKDKLCRTMNVEDISIDEIVDFSNEAGVRFMWSDYSPIWYRCIYDYESMLHCADFFQVVGHTPVEEQTLVDNMLLTDTFSTYEGGTPIGNEKLTIVDTDSFSYEIVG